MINYQNNWGATITNVVWSGHSDLSPALKFGILKLKTKLIHNVTLHN